MIRSILSIVIPVVTWGVLSVSANFAIYAMMPARFDENMIPNDPITLLIFLLLCTVLCILAGFLCAMIARSNPMKHVCRTMIINTLKAMVENGRPSFGTRMLYMLFRLLEPLSPKKSLTSNWPL